MTAFFSIADLRVRYGQVPAVDGVAITVDRGAIVSVVGPNGAGKTTMLNALIGLHPASGSVWFEGEDIAALPPEARLARGLCLVSERRELFSTMSVLDNLVLGGFTRRRDGRQRSAEALQDVFDRFPRLAERRTQLAGTLSGGERQMLAIGRALMARPKLLMLDEPSLGLAPRIVDEVLRTIVELRSAGVSILLVEQNARAALAASDYGYVLELGKVALSGESAALTGDPRVATTYLGATASEGERSVDS